jgi:hypothetical protein
VATPLIGAVKAVYLDSRGEMPEPEEQRVHRHVTRALRRRLRLGRPKDAEPTADGSPDS